MYAHLICRLLSSNQAKNINVPTPTHEGFVQPVAIDVLLPSVDHSPIEPFHESDPWAPVSMELESEWSVAVWT